jgi:hypothetical protein
MKMKAEITMMCLQANEYQRLPEKHQKLRENHGVDSSSHLSEGTNPTDTLTWTSCLQNCGAMNFHYLSHSICGTLF